MTRKVSMGDLRNRLPEILRSIAEDGQEYLIEDRGEECAVIIGAQEWRRTIAALGKGHGAPLALATDAAVQAGLALDALGPAYRFPSGEAGSGGRAAGQEQARADVC